MTPPIQGETDPRFARVRDAFAECFAHHHELGGGVAVVIGGRTVVDLWGGHVARARERTWQRDTLVNVYSTTKGWTAACVHLLVDEGRLDLDRPVADYWPEFAQADKGRVPVRALLDHRAGLPAIRSPLPPEALYDWGTMTRALAAESPWWEPDTKHGYHAVTFGWLVGEVIRRVAGMTTGRFFRTRIAEPLGLDAHIGLGEEDHARCAELRPGRRDPAQGPTLFEQIAANPESMTARAFTNPITLALPATVASREWRLAELPSVNGHATARAVAGLYGAIASGTLLSRESIARAGREHSYGQDAVLGVTTRFGLGYMLPQADEPFGNNEGSFGHPGAGGSVGFADPSIGLGFGYVTNRMGTRILLDPRAKLLIDAVYASL